MRVGYFGGSFDPPHRGHLAVALAARDRFELDRVLLAPTARQPLKPRGPDASFADRLRMTELLCAGHPCLEASAIDGPRPHAAPNYTADTLRRLRATLPGADRELFAIVGADAFAGFAQWHEPAELLRLAQWIVVSRPGFPLPNTTSTPGRTPNQPPPPAIHVLDGVADPVTATELRRRLHLAQDCSGLLPESVASYIQEHGLYGWQPPAIPLAPEKH